ncbi:hypothetical protein BB934_40975 (plasmid) [Microvirga ossetica]|uniref:Uncharacterized protein n=1 Tax=Microvirga ossetica TaxID=1882682 RepID=A0A1B2EX78_9HYPH|nr:hypothetical protein [Microvirga ossetica]ANY84563.1 hypothetical protein BB934_40975 [Microvirga ossetica]
MAVTRWEPTKEPQVGWSAWTGAYWRGDKTIRVHSRPGEGDVVATVDGRWIIAECTKGRLVHKAGRTEHSLLTTALGQALLFDDSADDIVVAAVPDTPVSRRLAEVWRERPLVRRADIRTAREDREYGTTHCCPQGSGFRSGMCALRKLAMKS